MSKTKMSTSFIFNKVVGDRNQPHPTPVFVEVIQYALLISFFEALHITPYPIKPILPKQ